MSERIKIADTLTEWRYTMLAARRSPNTITGYTGSIKRLIAFLEDAGLSTIVPEVHTRHLRMFLAYLYEQGNEGTTVLTRWAGLRAYFNFAVEAEMIAKNPMHGVARPTVGTKVVPAVPTDNIRALLNSCDRKTHQGSRDYAIMRLLMCGLRRGEIVGITLSDCDFTADVPTVLVNGKGSKQRRIALGPRDVLALTTYMRSRRKYVESRALHHPARSSDKLFIGKHGPLGGNGVEHMLRRRCAALNIKRANAHAWRHTWAGEWKAQGGSDEGLMSQGGWANNRMIARYTAHNRERTSMAEAQRLNIGGNL